MSSGKVLLGVLAGLAAGALIGILFAPDKGSETRKKVVRKGEEYADDIKAKINDLLDDLSQKIDEAKVRADKMASDAQSTVEDAKV